MKRITLLFFCLILTASLSTASWADRNRVVDDAELLTDAQVQELENIANNLRDTYGIDVVIYTTWSLDGKDPEAFADDYYDNNGYGVGNDRSGILLVLSMEYRDWAISTCGEGIRALPDGKIMDLFYSISPYLAQDDYYAAFSAYLYNLEPYLDAYVNQSNYDYDVDYGDYDYDYDTDETTFGQKIFRSLLISLGIGAVAGGITVGVLAFGMNTARSQHGAQQYVDGSVNITNRMDFFMGSSVSKTRRNTNTGGGSTHRSSGGFSHGGRHGKF